MSTGYPAPPVATRTRATGASRAPSDANEADLDKLIQTTEKYCVVFQTLATSPTLEVVRT